MYERGDDSALTSPRETSVEGTNGRDDVDWVGVVLRGLRNNFGNRQLSEEFPKVCSEGVVSPARTLGQHAAMLSVYTLSNDRSHAPSSRDAIIVLSFDLQNSYSPQRL